METRKIGSLEASVVGLGCNNFGWRLDAQGSARVVDAALDAGINFFDTADIYDNGRSEEFLGRALGKRRDKVLIASKFGHTMYGAGGAHPDYVRESLDKSLKRLGTDHLDLYQIHIPDPKVPIADTLGALEELVRAGKVREIGCSNFSAEQLREARAVVKPGAARFVSVQNEYSLLHREPEAGVLAQAERDGLAFLPYFPLASGLLTGKYRPGQESPTGARLNPKGGMASIAEQFNTPKNFALVERLRQFTEQRGHTLLELAFSWLLARPSVASVIAGATSPEQVRGNVAAAGWKLTSADLAEIDAVSARSS